MSALHNLPRGIDTDELNFHSPAGTEIALENGYHTESSHRTGCEGPELEEIHICTLSLTSALDCGG
jgi:hypothetical protein